jgi:hypothetical protein
MPWWISLKVPLVLAALGVLVALVAYPDSALAGPFFAIAVLWVLLTGRGRKIYWDTRLRSRARQDERDARSE